jgi:uncharacterized protein
LPPGFRFDPTRVTLSFTESNATFSVTFSYKVERLRADQCTAESAFGSKRILASGMKTTPITWLRERARQLVSLKDTPHAIAMGLAVGMFFGLSPLWGLKTLLALAVARVLQCNLIAAAIGVTLHDVILPVIPLLLRWEYDIGYWLLSSPHQLPPRLHLVHARPSVWLHWSTFLTVGRPLLVGSFVLAIPVSILTYHAALFVVERRRRKRTAPRGAEDRTVKNL